MSSHKREHKKQKYNIKFYNAIRKYGWDKFTWNVIYQSKDYEYCLNTMENFFIKEYDSIENGYNMMPGGCRGPILFGENNGMFGKTHSDEIKNHLAKECRERFKGKSYTKLYGLEKANELKQKRSASSKGKNNNYKNNPRFDDTEYKFFNTKTGQLLKCTQWVFYKTGNLTKPSTSEIVNKGISRHDWIVLYC
jgi:hypothetical protein